MRYPFKAYDNVAVSSTNTYYSTPADIRDWVHFSLHLFWGAVTGTFTLWVSNKEAPGLTNDDDWFQLSLATAISQPAGSAGNDWVDLSNIPARWLRAKYVNTSGSATISGYGEGKP